MIPIERVTEIFAEVDTYEITLANDPTVLGPKYLQDLIATCRNSLNHVARLVNEVHRASMAIDGEMRRKETAFKIAADELLAKHPNVKNLPNIADRQAQINLFLRDEHRDLERLRNDLRDMHHVEKYVRNKHRELKDSMNDIKLQRSLIRDEIDTGRMYGDERPSARESDYVHAYTPGASARHEDIDESELARILNGESSVEEEAPTEEAVVGEEVVGEEVVGEEAVVVEEVEAPTEEDAMFQSVLADLRDDQAVTSETKVSTSETIATSEPPVKAPEPTVAQSAPAPAETQKSSSAKLTEEEQVTAFLDKKPTPKAVVLSPDLVNGASSAISEQDYSDLFEQM